MRDGSMSLRDVLQLQAAQVRGSFEEVAALLAQRVSIDPAFAPFVRACWAREIPVTVVSSGLEPLIRGRLGAIGLSAVPIVANGIDIQQAGWRIVFRDDVANGTDKAAVIRSAREHGRRTIFVGDGRSDYAAALAADIAFAKRGLQLERYLRERGSAFTPFDSFNDIARSLDLLPPC